MPEQNADQRELAKAVRDIFADVRKKPSTGTSMRPVAPPKDVQDKQSKDAHR
jgi:hypothetical protein